MPAGDVKSQADSLIDLSWRFWMSAAAPIGWSSGE